MSSLKIDNEGHFLREMIDPESVELRWVKQAWSRMPILLSESDAVKS
jgi:hypothetical protein